MIQSNNRQELTSKKTQGLRAKGVTVATFLAGSALMLTLVGCGQKGDLYLVKPESGAVITGSDATASTSHPQDAAFSSIDDTDYDRERYLEQKQVLPDNSTDPNNY